MYAARCKAQGAPALSFSMLAGLGRARQMQGARCKVQGAPALSMLAGMGRARQMQGARCRVPGARCKAKGALLLFRLNLD